MSSARKFQGVWIPASLWLDHTLSSNEKVMLVEIASLEDEVRGCYSTNAHFAQFFGLSISRVSEIISGLAERGLITVELVREGKRVVERRLRLSNPFDKPKTPSENAANPFGKGDEPPSENTQGSNTKSSNTLRVSKSIGTDVPSQPDSQVGKSSARKAKFDPLTAKPENVSQEAWAGFCEMRARKGKGKELTERACSMIAKKLAGRADADAVVDRSTVNGWSDVYPDDSVKRSGKPSLLTNLPTHTADDYRNTKESPNGSNF
ncbi:hypothetical protein [Pseudomonas sp. UBA6323]|uniref:hypothetical protein n=1 Tax=Pseudomonas sp. UBA6323 TaxID=1947329 RepID=UPI0025E08AC4|nr:hypothetical protein [Pseudomonas sp. UBA6323]